MDTQDIISILVIIFGGSGIIGVILNNLLRSRIEKLQEVERNLRDERRKIYDKILAPYAKLFSALGNKSKMDEVVEDIKSENYKKATFDFKLIGSDYVIYAHNKMLQYTYDSEVSGNRDSVKMILLWGNLLLEIRKNLGNEKTKLNEIDMLRGMIKDIDKILKNKIN